jgi:hypothetical protein
MSFIALYDILDGSESISERKLVFLDTANMGVLNRKKTPFWIRGLFLTLCGLV